MKKLIYLIIFILLTSIALAQKECGRFTQAKDIPCIQPTSYHPLGDCKDYNATIYLNTTLVANATFQNYSLNCYFTFNQKEAGLYYWNSSIETGYITIAKDDGMESFTVILFLLAINLGMFILPFFIVFKDENNIKSEVMEYIVKRVIWILSVIFLWFNLLILMQISSNANLGIGSALFTYFILFSFVLLGSIIYLIYAMIVMPTRMMIDYQQKLNNGDIDAK